MMTTARQTKERLSISHGQPLGEEAGIGPLTLGAYLREIVSRHGSSEAAVMDLDDEVQRWSYDELLRRSLEVARALTACGVGNGTRVGILMTNRLEFLSSLFGTALAGGVGTTISTFFTAAEIDVVLQKSSCSVLLMERRVLKKDFCTALSGLEPGFTASGPGEVASRRYPFLTHIAVVDSSADHGAFEGWQNFLNRGATIADEQVFARADAVRPSDPGVLFFSSGSTGQAKGVLSAHRAVCLQLWRWPQWYRIAEPPRTWSANGFFFSGNFAMALGGTLSSGGCLLLQRTFDPAEAITLIERERGTMILAWPHQWPQLEAATNYASADLSSLHYVDAKFPIAHHSTVTADWREPVQAYGSTETFTLISVSPAGTPDDDVPGSHGVPTAGSSIKIVDPLSGDTVALGERGEISVKGPTLMLGYLGIPLDETVDTDGYYRTGDGGYLDESGRLFWEGRLNDIIKTGGANVSPLEIDAVIRDCPGVKMCQTVGVPDPLLGELVVTCAIAWSDQAISEEDVRAFARRSLASYKVPRRVLFFEEHEFETTGSSKIKTADLRKLASERLGADPKP